MIGILTAILSGIGRQAALWGALGVAVIAALLIAVRRGRRDAQADYAIRRAEARVRAMQTSKDLRHDIENSDRADLEHRADRWMRV